jgi:hypothetical protein
MRWVGNLSDILRTNEVENAIDYLEKAAYYYNNRKDTYWFKWLMISLHGALYGFGVCAVKGINTERVLEMKLGKAKQEKMKKEFAEYFKNKFGYEIEEKLLNSSAEYQLKQLIGIKDILEYCMDETYMMQRLDSKVLKITEQQRIAINSMVLHRNDFAHFKPTAISVILEGEEWVIKEVVDVIKFLALESNNVNYRNRDNKEKTNQIFEQFMK